MQMNAGILGQIVTVIGLIITGLWIWRDQPAHSKELKQTRK